MKRDVWPVCVKRAGIVPCVIVHVNGCFPPDYNCLLVSLTVSLPFLKIRKQLHAHTWLMVPICLWLCLWWCLLLLRRRLLCARHWVGELQVRVTHVK